MCAAGRTRAPTAGRGLGRPAAGQRGPGRRQGRGPAPGGGPRCPAAARRRAMRWATRAGVHIDRAACAWLIRRFLDPHAEFVFVDDPSAVPADATPFDMRGVELSHRGGDCTFETILRRYELTDPVLWRIAEAVHEADLDDGRFDAPEAAGLDRILRGLSLVGSDEDTLAASGPLLDGLYEFYRRSLLLGREPA